MRERSPSTGLTASSPARFSLKGKLSFCPGNAFNSSMLIFKTGSLPPFLPAKGRKGKIVLASGGVVVSEARRRGAVEAERWQSGGGEARSHRSE